MARVKKVIAKECNKGNSSMASDNKGNHFQTPINENSSQSNNRRLRKHDEIGHSAKFIKGSKSKVQNECLKAKEDRSFVSTIDKDSESSISLVTSSESLETSDSMLSFASTDAIGGSSSSDDELLDHFKNFSEKCESEDVSFLENPIFGLTLTADESSSNSSFATSFPDIDLDTESQATKCTFTGAKRSTLQEDSNPWQSTVTYNRFDSVGNLPSKPKERLCKNFRSKEFLSDICFSSMFAYRSLNNDKLYSYENTDTVPLLGGESSNNAGENETPESGTTGGFYNYDFSWEHFQKEDKSVRRKVKTKPSTSCKSDSLATRSSAPLVSGSVRDVGRSLLQISKSLEQTSHDADDSNINKTYGKGSEVMKHFTPKPKVKELVYFSYPNRNAVTTPRLDRESILKEVQQFFQKNCVVADESLSWKEMKYRIITSKYFSDEFSRSHGLLSNEKLMKEYLSCFQRYTYGYILERLKLKQLCAGMIKYNVSERAFIDYFKMRVRDGWSDTANQEHREDYLNQLLFMIEEETGFHVMLELYKKLTIEKMQFLSILSGPKKDPAAETFRCIEFPSISENSSNVPHEMFVGNQSTIDSDNLSLNQELSQGESVTIDCPTGEIYMPPNVASVTESSQAHSSESGQTSNVVSKYGSNILSSKRTEKETCSKRLLRQAGKVINGLESTNEKSACKDELNIRKHR